MENWELEDFWELEEDRQDFLYAATVDLAFLFFLSDNDFTPVGRKDYDLGTLVPESWWPLVNQLDGMVDLEMVISLAHALDEVLNLPGLPSELLEDPLAFLESVLEGSLPREPSGRRVDSRKLLKIGRLVVEFLREFPPAAQAAAQAWADVHRQLMGDFFDDLDFDDLDLADLLFAPDLPPALTGFSMMIGLTLMRWPQRAEGLPLPPNFLAADLYDEVFEEWESLPNSPTVTKEGAGEAEALFAQGQLAHLLAQMGAVELMTEDENDIDEEALALAYSRLSRAALWIHNQCRHCPERDGVACKAAAGGLDQPLPLLDVAAEIANTARIVGCIKM